MYQGISQARHMGALVTSALLFITISSAVGFLLQATGLKPETVINIIDLGKKIQHSPKIFALALPNLSCEIFTTLSLHLSCRTRYGMCAFGK